MRALVILVQVLVALFLTASAMPVLLATVPAAQTQGVGLSLMAVVFAVAFALVWLVWPGRRHTR